MSIKKSIGLLACVSALCSINSFAQDENSSNAMLEATPPAPEGQLSPDQTQAYNLPASPSTESDPALANSPQQILAMSDAEEAGNGNDPMAEMIADQGQLPPGQMQDPAANQSAPNAMPQNQGMQQGGMMPNQAPQQRGMMQQGQGMPGGTMPNQMPQGAMMQGAPQGGMMPNQAQQQGGSMPPNPGAAMQGGMMQQGESVPPQQAMPSRAPQNPTMRQQTQNSLQNVMPSAPIPTNSAPSTTAQGEDATVAPHSAPGGEAPLQFQH